MQPPLNKTILLSFPRPCPYPEEHDLFGFSLLLGSSPSFVFTPWRRRYPWPDPSTELPVRQFWKKYTKYQELCQCILLSKNSGIFEQCPPQQEELSYGTVCGTHWVFYKSQLLERLMVMVWVLKAKGPWWEENWLWCGGGWGGSRVSRNGCWGRWIRTRHLVFVS